MSADASGVEPIKAWENQGTPEAVRRRTPQHWCLRRNPSRSQQHGVRASAINTLRSFTIARIGGSASINLLTVQQSRVQFMATTFAVHASHPRRSIETMV